MAATTIRQELLKLAIDEKEDKNIAKILAYYYRNLNLGDKKTLFESLMYNYRIDSKFDLEKLKTDVDLENDTDSFKDKDYRIKSIEIENLRGIPEQQLYPFGINFYKDNQINNAIILANNGTGKSSVFAGIEMIYAQEIGEKKVRTLYPSDLNLKQYKDYLKRIQTDKRPICNITTNAGNFDLENVIFNKEYLDIFNPSNHFISDYNIYHYGQLNFDGNSDNSNSFHYLLATTLGLGDFVQLESILSDLINYRRATESNTLSKLQREEREVKLKIIEWGNSITEKTKILEVQKIKNQKSKISDTAKRQLEQIRDLNDKQFSYDVSFHQYLNCIIDFEKQYSLVEVLGLDKHLSEQNDFLELGLGILIDFDDCPFCRSSNKSIETIHKDVSVRSEDLKLQLIEKDKLKKMFITAIEQINNYHQKTQYLYSNIEREIETFKSYEELSIIAINAQGLLEKLTNYVEDFEIWEKIERLNQLNYPKDEDYKFLFELINAERFQLIELHIEHIDKINNYLVSRKIALEELLEKSLIKFNTSDLEKQVVIIEDEIKRLQSQVIEGQKRVLILVPEIEKAQKDVELVKTIKSEIEEFLPKYKIIANSLVTEAFYPVKDMIITIMSDFLEDDKNIQLIIETKETKKVIDGEEKIESLIMANIQYLDINTGEIRIAPPSHYFNTFRYKLFCLMVSLSLALSTRKKYGINLPLVMDDLFYASDFVSKHRFSKFLSKVIELFYKYTPQIPLQFILFTHDDMIFRNAIDSLIQFDKTTGLELQKSLIKDTIIGRIFNPNEKDDLKTIEIGYNQSIYNLVYELPQEIINN